MASQKLCLFLFTLVFSFLYIPIYSFLYIFHIHILYVNYRDAPISAYWYICPKITISVSVTSQQLLCTLEILILSLKFPIGHNS